MARVPLPVRGFAVLLLAASTVAGQTPEPPAELLSLDSLDSDPPDFLRQYSADPRHPLLALMVDGELTSFEAEQAKDSAKPKLTPKPSSTAPKSGASDGVIVDGCPGDGLLMDGCPLGSCLDGGCSFASAWPMPFGCAPPPCHCRKCQRKHSHNRCGGYDGGNPYLNWPTCPAWCFYGAPLEPCQGCHSRRCRHKHGGGCPGYGYPSGGCDGWGMDGCYFGCGMPYGPSPYCGNKCHGRRNRGCGSSAYGYPSYGGGWGMDGGFCGCWMPPPPSCGHKRHRRHGCSNYYGDGAYACPGWGGYDGMAPYYGCGYGCGGHHGRRSRRCGQQPYFYPMMMPCMDMTPCMGTFSGVGMMSDLGSDSFVTDGMVSADSDDGTMLSGIFN